MTDSSLVGYENWLAHVLTAVWQPDPLVLNEIHKGLHHPAPSPELNNTSATWSWTKG